MRVLVWVLTYAHGYSPRFLLTTRLKVVRDFGPPPVCCQTYPSLYHLFTCIFCDWIFHVFVNVSSKYFQTDINVLAGIDWEIVSDTVTVTCNQKISCCGDIVSYGLLQPSSWRSRDTHYLLLAAQCVLCVELVQ